MKTELDMFRGRHRAGTGSSEMYWAFVIYDERIKPHGRMILRAPCAFYPQIEDGPYGTRDDDATMLAVLRDLQAASCGCREHTRERESSKRVGWRAIKKAIFNVMRLSVPKSTCIALAKDIQSQVEKNAVASASACAHGVDQTNNQGGGQ